MKLNKRLFNKLKKVFPKSTIIDPDNSQVILIHNEAHEENGVTCDYYGEFTGGYPWINPDIEKIAEKAGYFCEWNNPGSISLYEK